MPAFLRLRLLSRGMRPVLSRFFAKFLVLQARLSLSFSSRVCVRERKEERERQFVPLTLRFFHPFLLSLSFSHRADPSCLRAAVSYPPSLSLSLPLLAFSMVLSLTGLSPRSHSFSSSPSTKALLPSGSPSSRWFVLFLFVLLFSRGWFSTRLRARVSLPLVATTAPTSLHLLLPLVLFCPCRSLMFCALRI